MLTKVKQVAVENARSSVKRAFNVVGLDVRRSTGRVIREGGAEVFQYTKPDGSFDYERYRAVQTAGNRRKIGQVWAIEENIAFLSEYVKRVVGEVEMGICHGTRRGTEQAWFRQYLGGNIFGTEISDTATQFPHTIQWDFHETKPEWIGAAGLIYSNAFDHSYDPKACLNAWMRCVKPGGVCILEHSSVHERPTELDPFGALLLHMPYLVLLWGEGRFHVREILDAPKCPESVDYLKFLVIQHTV